MDSSLLRAVNGFINLIERKTENKRKECAVLIRSLMLLEEERAELRDQLSHLSSIEDAAELRAEVKKISANNKKQNELREKKQKKIHKELAALNQKEKSFWDVFR